ncbi:hypothetical protein [Lonsdalea quercina]|uniref:hypothetical protein n=1 Tax=Lonsdalea quercina TaxID=71657 RepID=UPI00397589B6
MFKTLGLLLFLIVSLPAHSADNLKRSCGVLINSGGNTFLFYNKSGIKEFETNKKDKQLMLKKYSCACMSYKYKNEEYIRGITKVEFVNENFCSRQKEIGEIYVSKIDRAGYGMPPAGIDNDKSNKL